MKNGKNIEEYRKPTKDDLPEDLVKGYWAKQPGGGGGEGGEGIGIPKFIPDNDGDEFAVFKERRKGKKSTETKEKRHLRLIMSDEKDLPDGVERPIFHEWSDPMSDRDLKEKGIIWVNAINPIIAQCREEKNPEYRRLIADFALIIVAQYQAQIMLNELGGEPLSIFRQRYWELQKTRC